MRIYCTRHDADIQLAKTHGSLDISIMARAVYSHTTLNAIQYYIIIIHQKCDTASYKMHRAQHYLKPCSNI